MLCRDAIGFHVLQQAALMTQSLLEKDICLSKQEAFIVSTLDHLASLEAKDIYSQIDRLLIFNANTAPLKKFLFEKIEEKKYDFHGNDLTAHAFHLNEWQFIHAPFDKTDVMTSCLDFVDALKQQALETEAYIQAKAYNEWHYTRYNAAAYFSDEEKQEHFNACSNFLETIVETALDSNHHQEAFMCSRDTPHNPFPFWKEKTSEQCLCFLKKMRDAAISKTEHADVSFYSSLLNKAQQSLQENSVPHENTLFVENITDMADRLLLRHVMVCNTTYLACTA